MGVRRQVVALVWISAVIQNEMGFPGKSLIYVPTPWELTLKEGGQEQGGQAEGWHSGAGGDGGLA